MQRDQIDGRRVRRAVIWRVWDQLKMRQLAVTKLVQDLTWLSDGSETARAQSSYEPLTFVNVEFHGAFIPHFQQQRLASFLIWDIRTLHYLKDLMRLFAQCT